MDQDTLYAQAEAAIKEKRIDDARRLLMSHVVVAQLARHFTPDGLVKVEPAIDCLKRVLALNPNNETAKEWLTFAEQEKARQAAVAEMKA